MSVIALASSPSVVVMIVPAFGVGELAVADVGRLEQAFGVDDLGALTV